MHSVLIAAVILYVTSCASSEEHLVPKHGIEPKHDVRKRDISSSDAELILKLLLSKLEHGEEETELLHKKVHNDKEHYLHGSDIMQKAQLASMKEEMKYVSKGEPFEHDYMREKQASFEKDGYETKKGAGVSEKDIMDIIMKMKDSAASKSMEGAFKKEAHYETPEEVHLDMKLHLSKDVAAKGTPVKIPDYEMYPDKVSDKDVSLAESLYHMKIAGDVETYPDIKMAPLTEMYGKKIADDKLHLEETPSLHKVNSEDSFTKKIDDVGKTLLKEETYPHIKEDNTGKYLKKVAEEIPLYYEEKVAYPDTVISLEKTAEEKALDEWKGSHKEIFATSEVASSGETFELESGHHSKEVIAHEMNDELIKKFKTLAMDKEIGTEYDELLHLSKELSHGEGVIGHEMSDELMKKLKSFGIDKEIGSELLHLFKESQYEEGGIVMSDELVKKLKSLGISKEMGSELLHLFKKPYLVEEGISREMNDELMKKLKSIGIDKEIGSELLHLFKESEYAEGGIVMSDELVKKLKPFGIDKEMGSELLHLFKKTYLVEGGISHEMNDELMKKLKSFGIDKEIGSELLHLFKESQYAEGSISHEMSDELVKKLKSFGIDKEMGSELLHLFKNPYLVEGGISHEINDELMKKLKSFGIDKEIGSELLHLFKESQYAEGGIAMSDELVKKLKPFGIDKEMGSELLHLFKNPHLVEGDISHEMNDELMKKLKSFGIDKEIGSELLHLFKESQYAEGSISHEMSDALVKKLKSFGIDKEMGSELLHLFKNPHLVEGGISHEMNDELMKKLKSFGIDKEIGSELLHLFKESQYAEGSISHEMSDELVKKLKSFGIDKEMGSELLHLFKDPYLAKEGISHEMNGELMKKLKSLGIDKEMGAELLHLSKELSHAEGGAAHEMSDELIKKLKTLGIDKEKGIVHDELLHLSKDFFNGDGVIAHEMGDEKVKKSKALGLDREMGVKYDDHLHLSKEFSKEEGVAEGTLAYEKALEQALKDAHIHLSEEEMKKHVDESLKFGPKDVHKTEFFEKGLASEKAHGIDIKRGVGMEKTLYGIYGEESVKSKESHDLDETFALGEEKRMYGGKVALNDEVKYSKGHEIPFNFRDEKAIKAHEDELLKKGMTYGTDTVFHKEEGILKTSSDHHIPHKDEEAIVVHDKHHSGGVEQGHTPFHDLKAKFFELLKRVLRTRKCHLVTMRPSELLSIVNCISKSKDPALCEKFSICEKKMPFRVLRAKEKCQQETIPGGIKHCTRYAPLFPSPEIPVKLFQCVALNVRELMPEEKKHMIDFEECARALKAESCSRFKLFRGPH